ncbi:MAG: hypothetical protein HYY06_06080 [Deltaproteobacteria bacterium]|nr:hypothetical protein [Deltaproteobacteria bacterium]
MMELELLAGAAPILAGASWLLDRAERLRRDVRSASEGTIRDLRRMREGLVGVEGRIEALGAPIDDPVTGEPVIYYRWSVQRPEQSGNVELAERADRVAFLVSGDGVSVTVEPHRAQMRVAQSVHTVPIGVATRLAPVGRTDGPTLQAIGGTLPVGAPVYVLGVCHRIRGQKGPFRGSPDAFRIRAARGYPFVVSAVPEDELLKSCRRTAHRALAIGAGAFLAGAALLVAGMG